jgi:hypothetical protein
VSDIEYLDSDVDGAALTAAFEDVVSTCEPNLNVLVSGALDRSRRSRRHRAACQVAGSTLLVAAVGVGTALKDGGNHTVDPGSGATPTMSPTGPAMLDRDRTGPVLLSLVPSGLKALPDPDTRNNDIIVGDGGTRSATLLPIVSQNTNGRFRPMKSPADLACANVYAQQPDAYCRAETLPNGDTAQVYGGPSTKYPGETIYTATLLNAAGGYVILSEDLVAPAGTPMPITFDQLLAMVESPKWTPLF